MFEGGILSPRCRSGAYAARSSGRRPFRRLAALAGLLTLACGPAGRRGTGRIGGDGRGPGEEDRWLDPAHPPVPEHATG